MAMTMSPMTAAVMGSVPPAKAGVASAATNTSREIGGVFGIALLGAIVTSAFTSGFTSRLISAGVPKGQAAALVARAGARAAAGSSVGVSDPVIADAIKQSFVHAMHTGMLVAVAFLVFAAIVSAVFVRSHVGLEGGGPGGDGHRPDGTGGTAGLPDARATGNGDATADGQLTSGRVADPEVQRGR